MPTSLAQSAALDDLAQLLCDFLPGSRPPYADQGLSFGGVAAELGLSRYWSGGSKHPAIRRLLEGVLTSGTGRFTDLIVKIVERSITYRKRSNPLTRAEIDRLNALLLKVSVKIPALHDQSFLGSLAQNSQSSTSTSRVVVNPTALAALEKRSLELAALQPSPRGFAFEQFLSDLFSLYELAPRGSFRLVGEQIDGSFQIGSEVYLLEAKWENTLCGNAELLTFSGKVERKAQWSRGLFVSYTGFTKEGLQAFAHKPTNIICMDGLDLHHILSGKIHLVEAIERKARRAAETSNAFVPIRSLFPSVI